MYNQPAYLLKIKGVWWIYSSDNSLMAAIMPADFFHFLYRDGHVIILRSFEDAWSRVVYG